MDSRPFPTLAGSLSSLLFMLSTLPMLLKAARTRNLRSYSLANLALANLGNGLHWVYIVSLPVGPIWVLYGFSTATTLLMLLLYLRFRAGRPARRLPDRPPVGAQGGLRHDIHPPPGPPATTVASDSPALAEAAWRQQAWERLEAEAAAESEGRPDGGPPQRSVA